MKPPESAWTPTREHGKSSTVSPTPQPHTHFSTGWRGLLTLGLIGCSLSLLAGPPSTPFRFVDIGRNPNGSFFQNEPGSYSVTGGGNDIWDRIDECFFPHHEITGDFDVRVRVESLSLNSRWTKAGLMVRESLAEDSRMAFNRVTPLPFTTSDGDIGAYDTRFGYRTGIHEPTGNFSDDHNGGQHADIDPGNPYPNPPYPQAWLRLERIGSTITAYNSSDGFNWHFMATQNTATWNGGPLRSTLLVGLAVSRYGGPAAALAEFREYQLLLGSAATFAVNAASSRGNPNGIRVEFNHPVGSGAFIPSRYTVSGGITVSSAQSGPTPASVRLITSPTLTPGVSYVVQVSTLVNDLNGNPIGPQRQATFVHGAGYESRPLHLMRNMITGPQAALYTGSTAYARGLAVASQGFPAVAGTTNLVDPTPNDQNHENFSVRFLGRLNVTTPANYRFACSSDDVSLLFLSSDNSAINKVLIAYEPEFNGALAFASTSRRSPLLRENQSAPIFLNPGQYYFEFVGSEGGGGNLAAVAWDAGSGAAFVDGQAPMGTNLFASTRMFEGQLFTVFGPVSITSQPAPQSSVEGSTATFKVKVDGTPPYTLQWFQNGVPIHGANAQSYTTPRLTPFDHNTTYRVVISNEFSSIQSATVLLSVSTDITPPSVSSVSSLNGQSVGVCFSEPIDFSSAQTPSNYRINGLAVVDQAIPRPDGRSVLLVLNPSAMLPAGPFNFDCFNIRDQANDPNFGAGSTNGTAASLTDTELGFTSPPGHSFSCAEGQIELVAGGADVWGTFDEGHFLSQPITGNFDVRVRVQSLPQTHYWAKAGLMARQTFDADSPTVQTYATPTLGANQVESGIRRFFSSNTEDFGVGNRPGTTMPAMWLRLVRAGNTFTAYHCTDGINWVQHGVTSEPSFPPNMNVGLFGTSHDRSQTTTAQFTDFRFGGFPAIQQQPQDTIIECGGDGTLAVLADDDGTYQYQWQRNGTNIPGAISATFVITQAQPSHAGIYMVTIQNGAGTTTSQPASVQVPDTQPPVIMNCAPPQTIQANASCRAPIPNLVPQVLATDSCSPVTITQSPAPGTLVAAGSVPVTFTVTDASMNSVSCQTSVLIRDVTPPVINAGPADSFITANPNNCQAALPDLRPQLIATDACGTFTVAQTPVPGTVVGLGQTIVTLRAIDSSNNTNSFLSVITVRDGTPPTINSGPANRSLAANQNTCQATVPDLRSELIATDACGTFNVVQAPTPGTIIGLGQTTVTLRAFDLANNTNSFTTLLTVIDATPPRSTVCLDAPVQFENGGRDNFMGAEPAAPRAALLAALPGAVPRSFDDATANSTFMHSWINMPECITDTTLEIPLRAVPGTTGDDFVALGIANAGVFLPLWQRYLGADNPSSEPPLASVPWIAGAQQTFLLDLNRLPLANGGTIDLIPALMQNKLLDIVVANSTMVDYTDLDVASCRAREDLVAVALPGQAGTPVNFTSPPFTDACDPIPTLLATPASGTFFSIGRTPVVVTATDDAGNVGRNWFIVEVRDQEPPTLTCSNLFQECLKPSGAAVFFPVQAHDNSEQVTVQCTPASGSMFAIGTSPVLCLAIDGSGNTAQCQFTVTLTGRQPPTLRHVSLMIDGFSITFETQAGIHYSVEYQNNLGSPSWVQLALVIGTGNTATVVDPTPMVPTRFYRVVAVEPALAGGVKSIYEAPPEPPHARPGTPEECRTPSCGPPHVYAYSGEFHLEATDLCIKGRGLDFIWARKYRSCICWYTALGYAWDYSYNICIVPNGPHLDVLDGNTRQDTYYRQADGSFEARGFFREGRFEPDGRFILTFADQGQWEFLPLNGGAAQGRIAIIRDRNGNALRFNYSVAGRLTNIIDTLDRHITVSYDADGFISAVTDFAGRQVRYEHYQNGDANGSFGDLKRVISPIVIDAPNGNNFPGGKTNTYTYSIGSPEMQLNHNLLTVTDAKGQTWLQNTYGSSPDFACDQVIRQVWGYSNEVLRFSYRRVTPAPANAFAISQTIINDRVGNVSEYYFDLDNRCLLHRAFTGRAVPDVPVTPTANRPANKLRSNDPDFYDTRWEWNADSLPVRITHPALNFTENRYEAELNPLARARARGNLRVRRQHPGPLGGDQPELNEYFKYGDDFGGCCGANFVTRAVDARGNITLHSYDTRGNRVRTQHRIPSAVEEWEYNEFGQTTARIWPNNGTGHRRRDAFFYYEAGHQRGYLAREVIDAQSQALTKTFEYDLVGNVVRTVDPRGGDTRYLVNALNQVLRENSPEVQPGSGIRYQRDFAYDANNNLVRVDTGNRDETGALQANAAFTTLFEHEILNRLVRIIQEKGNADLPAPVQTWEAVPFAMRPQFLGTEYAYDANRNRVLDRQGEAFAGFDPANFTSQRYDERDLLFRETRAPGSPLQSTTQFDYDANANRSLVSRGLEDTPRITTWSYDGYNRNTRLLDPLGNVTTYHYDPNCNLVSERLDGELFDLAGGAGNRRLTERFHHYDAMDRRIRTDRAWFDPVTQQTFDDGLTSTSTAYNDLSQIIAVTDDLGHGTFTLYDSVNRPASVTDAEGNQTLSTYEGLSNLVMVTRIDQSDLGGSSSFFTNNQYDGLNRLVATLDGGGAANQFAYDSRNLQTSSTDPRGNVTRFEYDGANRLVTTTRLLTDTGDGSGTLVGSNVTRQVWDDSCRLIAQIDPNQRITRYAYDALNRRIITRLADGAMELAGAGSVNWPEPLERPVLDEFFWNGHDVHHNVLLSTDANGTKLTTVFDLLERPVNRAIDRAPGVLGATFETFQYTGASQIGLAKNNSVQVTRRYDSLGNLLRESVNFDAPGFSANRERVIRWTWDSAGNPISCTYPGGRILAREFDGLHRLVKICQVNCLPVPPAYPAPGSVIAQLFYAGSDRLEALCYGNGSCALFGFDALARTTSSSHMDSGARIIDQRSYAWDPSGNKTQRLDTRPGGPGLSHIYNYDSLNALNRTEVANPINPTVRLSTYLLDQAGNRLNVSSDPAPGNYVLSPTLPDPADAQVNQYTSTPFDSGRAYDANGNLIMVTAGADTAAFSYDFRNRLVQVQPLTATPIFYTYDPLGRRVQRLIGDRTTRFFHEAGQEIEETDAADVTLATLVRDPVTGQAIALRRGATELFYHHDDAGNVVGLSGPSGAAVERYDYGDFGDPIVVAHVQAPNTLTNFVSDPDAGQLAADEILFPRTIRLGGLRWWGQYGLVAPPATDNFTIRLHANTAARPGAVLFAFAAGNAVQRRATGRLQSGGEFEFIYEVLFPSLFTAQAGTTYWLSVINDTTGESANWAIGSAPGNLRHASSSNGGASWTLSPGDMAFELLADESPLGNPVQFGQQRYEPETGFYFAPERHLDPVIGRFISRDPGGAWHLSANLGNPFTFRNNNPWSIGNSIGRDTPHPLERACQKTEFPGLLSEPFVGTSCRTPNELLMFRQEVSTKGSDKRLLGPNRSGACPPPPGACHPSSFGACHPDYFTVWGTVYPCRPACTFDCNSSRRSACANQAEACAGTAPAYRFGLPPTLGVWRTCE